MLVTGVEKDHFAVQIKSIPNITSRSPGGSASAACTSHHFAFPASLFQGYLIFPLPQTMALFPVNQHVGFVLCWGQTEQEKNMPTIGV